MIKDHPQDKNRFSMIKTISMKNVFTYVALCLILATTACTTTPAGQVKIEDGILQGSIEDGLEVYKGIPFARPPVGDLRWKAPQAVEKWEGVKLATEFGPAPVQGGNPPSGKSEDCLYLNIWTPCKKTDERNSGTGLDLRRRI